MAETTAPTETDSGATLAPNSNTASEPSYTNYAWGINGKTYQGMNVQFTYGMYSSTTFGLYNSNVVGVTTNLYIGLYNANYIGAYRANTFISYKSCVYGYSTGWILWEYNQTLMSTASKTTFGKETVTGMQDKVEFYYGDVHKYIAGFDNKVELKKTNKETFTSNKSDYVTNLAVTGQEMITTATVTASLQSAANATVAAGENAKLAGTISSTVSGGTLTLTGTTDAALSAGAQLSLKGNAGVSIGSGAGSISVTPASVSIGPMVSLGMPGAVSVVVPMVDGALAAALAEALAAAGAAMASLAAQAVVDVAEDVENVAEGAAGGLPE